MEPEGDPFRLALVSQRSFEPCYRLDRLEKTLRCFDEALQICVFPAKAWSAGVARDESEATCGGCVSAVASASGVGGRLVIGVMVVLE